MPRFPTFDREFEALQATAEALLRQCPRLELMSFVRRMGLPIKGRRNRHGIYHAHPAKQAQAAIAQLEQAGVIRLQAPTSVRESVLVCRPGYQPRQPGNGYITPCTSRIDPALQTWQPGDRLVRSRIADIPTAVNWREQPSTPTETNDMTRTKENYDKMIAAIQQAEQEAIGNGSYKMPSRNDICCQLGLEDYLYNKTINGKKAAAEYFAAQSRLEQMRSARVKDQEPEAPGEETRGHGDTETRQEETTTPHTPHPTPHTPQTPDPYQLKLEADNARLRAEIEALRAQIKQAPTSDDAFRDRTLLQALKDEDQKLRLDAAKLLDRISELEQTRQQLLSNAEVIQRLIEQRESAIEREETAVATNGHKALAGVA